MPLLADASAKTAEAVPPKQGQQQDGGGGEFPTPLLPMLAIFAIFIYMFVLRPQNKERSRRELLLAAMKKNDRVFTASGIYGVVTNVHREANEVTSRWTKRPTRSCT